MNVKFSVPGAEELARALERLPSALKRKMVVDALKAGGALVADEAGLYAPIRRGKRGGHLADNIIVRMARGSFDFGVGVWSAGDEQERAVAVGPPKPFFYGLFQEYGTKHHAAQPFMRPALDAKAGAALRTILDDLWTAIDRQARVGAAAVTTAGRTGR